MNSWIHEFIQKMNVEQVVIGAKSVRKEKRMLTKHIIGEQTYDKGSKMKSLEIHFYPKIGFEKRRATGRVDQKEQHIKCWTKESVEKLEELKWREWEKEGSTKTLKALQVMADMLPFIQSLKDTTRADVRQKLHKINIILFVFCSCLKENLYLHIWSWEFMLIKEPNELYPLEEAQILY